MNLSVDRDDNASSSRKLFLDTKTLGLLKEKDRIHPILGSTGFDKSRMISIAFAFYLEKDDDSAGQNDSGNGHGENYCGMEYHFTVRNHGFQIPPYIELKTGISNEDSKNMETTINLKDILETLMEFVDENTEIVAQDPKFHKIVIANELFHSDMLEELELWKSLPTYCTMENSKTSGAYIDTIRNFATINLKNKANLHTSIQAIKCCLLLFNDQRKSALLEQNVLTKKQEPSGTCLLYTSPSPRDS